MRCCAGQEVTLIAGPTNLPDVPFVKMVHITSAQDMYEAVTEAAKESDIIVKAAAVAITDRHQSVMKKSRKATER